MIQSAQPIVLIVEDEALVRMLAVDAFLDDGFVVFEAEHAAAALDLLSDGREIHLLFTDVNMPGALNGIDLAERLKREAPHVHVIITSALPILRAVDHLPATFIEKPYRAQAVCQAARELLAA